jgi:hypothetical protein
VIHAILRERETRHFARKFFSETLFSEGTTLVPRAHDTRTTPRSDRNRPALTYRDNMTATNQPHAGQAIPGLLNDIVTTIVFRSDVLPDTRDLARLRAVSCAMRDAVDATGREVKELKALEAAEIGCISVLERLHENGHLSLPTAVSPQNSAHVVDLGLLYRVTARFGQLEVLKWLRAKNVWWDHLVKGWHFYAFAGAAEGGNIEIIEWVLASGQQWDSAVCGSAALFGQLEVLKWLHTNGCPWDEWTCASAAKGGHLEVLQWARENGCPWDQRTCAFASGYGHLEVLKWVHENDCPWDELICAGAAKGGHLAVLQWARENGCPWNEDTCAGAAAGGHLEVLKWARENDCPWDFRTLSCAHKHHEVMQWAILNGCPQGYDDYYDSGFDTEFGHSDDPFVDPWHDSEDEEDDGFW